MTRWPSLSRARVLGRRVGDGVAIAVLGMIPSLLIPVLVLILGLIVQLTVDRGRLPPPTDAVYRLWIDQSNWPLLGRADYCLLLLISVGLVIALVISVCLLLLEGAVQRSVMRVVGQLKQAIHDQSVRLGASDFLDGRGSLAESLFTDQIEQVRRGLTAWWRAIPRAAVALAALVLLAFAVDFLLALLAILMTLMIWRCYGWLRQWSEHGASIWGDRTKQRHRLLLEAVRVAPLITTLIRSRTASRSFADSLRHYTHAALRWRMAEAVVGPVLLFVVLFSAAWMLLVIGLSPRMTVTGSLVLGTALICAYFPAVQLFRLPPLLADADRAAREIFAYLDREPVVLQLSGARVLDRLRSGIELDRVSLGDAQGTKLLDNVSLAVTAGQRVGAMASDHRTLLALAGLFVRLYDPSYGRVLFDGRDIRHVTLESLRQQAALVRSSNMLFTGQVAENIDCGDSRFSVVQITEAAKRAGAYDFIQQLPHGFSTIIGDNGQPLTPRQQFRIALARALLRDPSLLLIEEPPDNPDDQDDDLDKTLEEIAADRTLIFLPCRLSTLRSLDRIFVFHEGKLHAEGTHTALLQTSELYRHLNYLLFNPFRHSVR